MSRSCPNGAHGESCCIITKSMIKSGFSRIFSRWISSIRTRARCIQPDVRLRVAFEFRDYLLIDDMKAKASQTLSDASLLSLKSRYYPSKNTHSSHVRERRSRHQKIIRKQLFTTEEPNRCQWKEEEDSAALREEESRIAVDEKCRDDTLDKTDASSSIVSDMPNDIRGSRLRY